MGQGAKAFNGVIFREPTAACQQEINTVIISFAAYKFEGDGIPTGLKAAELFIYESMCE